MDKPLPVHQQDVPRPLVPTPVDEGGQLQQTTNDEVEFETVDRRRRSHVIDRLVPLLIAIVCLPYIWNHWFRTKAEVPASQSAVDALLGGSRHGAEHLYVSGYKRLCNSF